MQSPFMKTRKLIILISLSLLSLSSESFAQSGTCAGMDIGRGGDLNGFIPFPADNAWNTDISSMPVDPNSDNIIAFRSRLSVASRFWRRTLRREYDWYSIPGGGHH